MAELYAPGPPAVEVPGTDAGKGVQVWRVLMSWVAIFCSLLLQILRATGSRAKLLSFIDLCHSFLFPTSSASPAYKPLAVVDQATGAPSIIAASGAEPVNRLKVVLDLDETLVCAYETWTLSPKIRTRAVEAGVRCFDLDCVYSERDVGRRQMINRVTVFERPGLREFLKLTSEFADLILFTAGLEGYASPVVDRIDVDKKFTRRLEGREYVKDLTCISKDLSRIVIVDNNPFSFLLQPSNGISCEPFFAAQPCDGQLLGVILPLLKELSQQKDVRPVLHEKLHMLEWFEQEGFITKSAQ